MERMFLETKRLHVPGGHRRPGGVVACVEQYFDLEATARARTTNQVHHCLIADQGLPAPIHADEREQAMLDLVPFARSGGIVADRDRQAEFVGQPLQEEIPGPQTVATASPGV